MLSAWGGNRFEKSEAENIGRFGLWCGKARRSIDNLILPIYGYILSEGQEGSGGETASGELDYAFGRGDIYGRRAIAPYMRRGRAPRMVQLPDEIIAVITHSGCGLPR
jgi:hypothetical protein